MNEPQSVRIKQVVFDWLDDYERAVISPDHCASPQMDFMENWRPNRATAFHVAVRWAEAGRTVLYLSLDVSLRHKLSTHFSETLNMDVWQLTRRWLSKRTMEGLGNCIRKLQPLRVFCSSCEMPSAVQLGGYLNHARLRHGAQFVAVDGADSILPSVTAGGVSRLSGRSAVIRSLKDLQELHGYQAGFFVM